MSAFQDIADRGSSHCNLHKMAAVAVFSFSLGMSTVYFGTELTYAGCDHMIQYCACANMEPGAQKEAHGKSTIREYVNVPVPADPADGAFECVAGKLEQLGLHFPVCIFNPYFDIHVSAHIKQHDGEMWEADNIVRLLGELGPPAEDAGFIDVGANIGVFSLSAAHAGHRVVSVEPMPAALRRFKQSLHLGGIAKRVKIVQAGLSNQTEPLYLARGRLNKGGTHLVPEAECSSGIFSSCDRNNPIPLFHMDDLAKVIQFKRAVMKIDCEGFEYRVFKNASKLFDAVDIRYIEMEWMHHKTFYSSDTLRPEAENLIKFFTSRGYRITTIEGDSLESVHWKDWPMDIAISKS